MYISITSFYWTRWHRKIQPTALKYNIFGATLLLSSCSPAVILWFYRLRSEWPDIDPISRTTQLIMKQRWDGQLYPNTPPPNFERRTCIWRTPKGVASGDSRAGTRWRRCEAALTPHHYVRKRTVYTACSRRSWSEKKKASNKHIDDSLKIISTGNG